MGHDNADVQAALLALHEGQNSSPLIDLCRRYAHYHDNQAGLDAVSYLRSAQSIALTSSAALESLKLVLEEPPNKLSNAQDAIISELARQNAQVRQYLAQRLVESTTEFFEDIFARGDEAANCLRSVVLEHKLWQSEDVRLCVLDDLFVLFIAKLMESGHDFDGRALKGITLLLLADTFRLYPFIDEDAFDALLTSLDFRLSADVRGQATLVIAKFMEISELEAQKYFSNFITARIARQRAEDLIVSFSAAAQLFPVATNITAQLFLTEGFLAKLMPLLFQKYSSPMVHDSFLALVNAACIDSACRKAIQDNCASWLSHKVSNGTGRQPAMAATILAKLRTANRAGVEANKAGNDDTVSDLVDVFQNSLVVEDEDAKNISDSIEGLAYTSLRPEVKERLASNPKLIKTLLEVLGQNPSSPEITIGGLSIISNLTNYQPNLSEEQKKMAQLKAYANASKPADVSELDDDLHVEKRCNIMVKAGVTATLVKINKTPSSAVALLTDKILVSLTRSKGDRGTIAQQGAVKLLITHCQAQDHQASTTISAEPIPKTKRPALSRSQSANAVQQQPSHDAAHALARILISLNPSHIFPASSTPSITSAVPPLASLLKPPPSDGPALTDTEPRDLLPLFESLLALTNLASSPNSDVASVIIRTCLPNVEDLLLSTSNDLVRRAAVELLCNLVAHPQGIVLYADASAQAQQRLRILIAMADVDDEKTRSAAGGALAMLTDFEEVRKAIIEDDEKFPRTVEIVLDTINDENPGLKHRGFAVLFNLLQSEDTLRAAKVKAACTSVDAVNKVKAALRDVRDQACLETGIEVLKILMGKKP